MYVNRGIPGYMIIKDESKGDYIIQRYINSVLGWTFVTTRQTLEEAEQWILEGVIKSKPNK